MTELTAELKEWYRDLIASHQRWCEQHWDDTEWDFQMQHKLTDEQMLELADGA